MSRAKVADPVILRRSFLKRIPNLALAIPLHLLPGVHSFIVEQEYRYHGTVTLAAW